MEKEKYLENILNMFIESSLETLDYNPCNSDWEFSEKTYLKTIESIKEMILDEQPEMPFTYIRDYLKQL